ncbi:MAG: SusD/RagB family nutrient-binding outer membrane lipoprotein [Catalinimonas sp.]
MKKILALSATLLTVAACDFGDTNVDPAKLSDVQLPFLLPSAEAHVGFTRGAIGARNAGIIMQYFEGTDAQQLQYTSYTMPADTYNNMWRTGLYGGAMKDLNKIIVDTDAAVEGSLNAPYYSGIAKVLMADMLGMSTSFFGDVPFRNAFRGEEGITEPEYDLQEQNFEDIQRLLDEAIAELSGDEGDIVPGADDYIFGGDNEAWIATAYTLKARYHLMLSRKGQANVDAARTALANAISSNADNAYHPFGAALTASNPFFQFETDRSNTMILADYFVGLMEGDPRESLVVINDNRFANGFWTSATSPVKIANYAEVKFMEAEIAQRSGDFGGAGVALAEAVRANMEEMGVDEADISGYLSGLAAVTAGDAGLEVIINEKYKGLYPQTIPWADYRRTGFPTITPDPNFNESLTPSGSIPRRVLYPESEVNFNLANLDVARTRQDRDGNGLLLDDQLWAFIP